MGHGVAQDPVYAAALFVFFAMLALLPAIGVAILAIRERNCRRDALRRELQGVWRPAFAQALMEEPASLPTLDEKDAPVFCELWNYVQNSLRGPARANLIAVATRLSLERMALRMLDSGRLGDRLLACITLGNMRHAPAWDRIVLILQSPDPVLSLVAAQALMRIDPPRALALVVPMLGNRPQWPIPNLASIFQEAGPDAVTDPLCTACLSVSPDVAARLARLLPMAHYQKAEATGRQMLAGTNDKELMTSCLRLLRSPVDRDLIAPLLEHPAWEVRLQAVKAMGRIATDAEVPVLVQRLTDEAWWVRFRAAEALAAIPTFDLYRWEGWAGLSVKSDVRSSLLQILQERKQGGRQ